jgi:hypothetical protein
MDEYRVPKRRVPVEILLAGGSVKQAILFLSEFALDRAGPERVSDLLNGPGDFIPAVDGEFQDTTFFNRLGILLVRVEPSLEGEEASDLVGATEHRVEVHLDQGNRIAGKVQYHLPQDRSRIYDYLNSLGRFVRVSQGQTLVLINKQHITHVRVIDG